MKRERKVSELFWVFGLVFVALGICICRRANLGVSANAAPAFVVSEAAVRLWSGFSVGVTEYIIQGILLIILCVIVRRFNWRYILAFAVAVVYGYTLNLFLWLLKDVYVDAVWQRWLTLVIGDVIMAFGVACLFRTYMPLQVYELFVAETASRFKLDINKTKWVFDFSVLAASVLTAVIVFRDIGTFDWSSIGYSSYHNMGIGTIVTTIINTPLITMWGKIIDRFIIPVPLSPGMERVFKRKNF
ncbi:MAG: DUF6198 family protein [Clostridiales bacterium]|nr:DUF6198 family protein [Clostridiales bacterium]